MHPHNPRLQRRYAPPLNRRVVRRSKMFLVELALIFVVAQALGLTVLYWASRRASRARAALAPFTAAAAYLTASWVFWSAEADRVAAATGRPPCRRFGAVFVFVTFV